MFEIMNIELLSSRDGDRITIIPSGYEDSPIVVFDDPAYNVSAKYLTNELYRKLKEEDRLVRKEQNVLGT